MNKKIIKILIPIVAVLVVVESIILISKISTRSNVVEMAPEPSLVKSSVTLRLKEVSKNEVSLVLVSDKDVAIDAVDLYVKYDPSITMISEAIASKDFVSPSFKKINQEKGLVVMNFLVTEASGFQLKAGMEVELVKLMVNYSKDGVAEFGLEEGTLVVENATAKVLPFNSDKLVINVSR